MIYLGCAWYPEHWPRERWSEDLRLMRAAGFNFVRVGEFAWSRLEPAESFFQLDWLTEAIGLAADYGLATVISTPTAAPPAWLTQTYPEVLAVREDGRRAEHGNRTHFSPSSPRYRTFAARIAEVMAQQFGANPHVIGWQIDNEYNSLSFDPETRIQFQNWLAERYGDLEKLNRAWSTAYWSQEYTDWSQIPLPTYSAWDASAGTLGQHNPALSLACRRFMTQVYRDYQQGQIDAIRRHAGPRQWITHNFIGWIDVIDQYTLAEPLDMAAWDTYVGSGHLNVTASAFMHDLIRGLKRRNYWVMETQPGSVNWAGVNSTLHQGEVRTMFWHAVGHGADAVAYWQWRSAPGGQEQYHGSLIAQDGRPRPVYNEIAQIGQELARVSDLLRDTTPGSEIALLHSFENRWAIQGQRHHQDFSYLSYLIACYQPLQQAGHSVDVLHPGVPLAGYRVVIAPALHLLTPELAERLTRFVENGGHVMLGVRTGFKDEENALLPTRQPGLLRDLAGVHVEEFYALDEPVTVSGEIEGQNRSGTATIWAEWLQPDTPDAEILLRYGTSNGWLDGQAAVVTRKVGSGRVTTLGAWLDEPLTTELMCWIAERSGLTPHFVTVPEGVEICRRERDGKVLFIVINHTFQPVTLDLPEAMIDSLTQTRYAALLTLDRLAVALLTPIYS